MQIHGIDNVCKVPSTVPASHWEARHLSFGTIYGVPLCSGSPNDSNVLPVLRTSVLREGKKSQTGISPPLAAVLFSYRMHSFACFV